MAPHAQSPALLAPLLLAALVGMLTLSPGADATCAVRTVNSKNKESCNCQSSDGVVAGYFYLSTETPMSTIPGYASDSQTCCQTCAVRSGCVFWEWRQYASGDFPCRLFRQYNGGSGCPIGESYDFSDPDLYNVYVGGSCNPATHARGDPHLVGARGTAFDFNGLPGKTFCLVTDKELQINMGIEGYYGAPGSTGVVERGSQELHTWAKSLSIFWLRDGKEHVLVLRTRGGLNASRAAGSFLAEATLDGARLQPFQLSGSQLHAAPAAGLEFRFEGVGLYGRTQETEKYSVAVEGHALIEFVLRPALAQLRSASDAYIHFDLTLKDLELSADVHGVLGQTYRADRNERTVFYQKLARQINGRMHVDGPHASASGFLDGALQDYQTGGLLDAACPLSRFNGRVPVTTGGWEAPPVEELLAIAESAQSESNA